MAERLFNKVWKVIGYPPRPAANSRFGAFLDENVPAIEIENLRVRFNIEKNLRKSPNTCDIVISNMAPETRGFFEQRPFHVHLQAGFSEAGGLRHLFRGDIRWGDSAPNGPDIETTLQLGDGDRAFRYASISKSYKGGVPVMTLLRDVAKSMGAELPASLAAATELQEQIASGTVVHGASAAALTKILAPYGMAWSIQDGVLQVMRHDDVKAGEGFLISEDTGMIDSPKFSPPARPTKSGKVKHNGKAPLSVRCQLFPQITPGGKITVQSEEIFGSFKVERVVHVGDTHGEDWTTEIEAIPL